MALKKEDLRQLLDTIDGLFDEIPAVPKGWKEFLQAKLLGPALKDIRAMVDDARPPVFFLVGRSGAGKSSLINALAGREVAEPSPVKAGTAAATRYSVEMPNGEAWTLVDSRGIFDPDKPDGGPNANAVKQLEVDLAEHKPDIVLHVLPCNGIRNASEEATVVRDLTQKLKIPASAMVLTGADVLGNPRHWPLTKHPEKETLIAEAVKYAASIVGGQYSPLDEKGGKSHLGVKIKDGAYGVIVPVALTADEVPPHWNIETVNEFIFQSIPKNALLAYAQGAYRKRMLEEIANRQVKQFSAAAFLIGASPIPVSDIVILTPLQALMIAIIAGLSCRKASWDTAKEFLAAIGIAGGAGFGFRLLAQQFSKLFPPVSAAIAASGTYALGKSAIAYFFSNEQASLKAFKGESDEFAEGLSS